MGKASGAARRYRASNINFTETHYEGSGLPEMRGVMPGVRGMALELNRFEGRPDGRVPYLVMPTNQAGKTIWSAEPLAKGFGNSVMDADKRGIAALVRLANKSTIGHKVKTSRRGRPTRGM